MDIGIWSGNNTVATGSYLVTVAEAADRLGFASIWVSDHVVWPQDYDSPYPYDPGGKYPADVDQAFCEAIASMTWISAHTARIKVGSLVIVLPQREPWLLGKQLATLDAFNGGRTIFGAGMGWLREEFDTLHASFDDRYARGTEAVSLLRAMWTENPASFDGRFWQAPPTGVLPHPTQPSVPIWLGGHGPGALRRAGRIADGWIPFGLSPQELRSGLAAVRAQAEGAGRDPGSITCALWAPLWLADPQGTPYAPMHGPADQLIDQLGEYAEAGLDHLVMFNLAPPEAMVDQLEEIAEDVLPAIRNTSQEDA
jgi:probable F420-dependent oxidoreductase